MWQRDKLFQKYYKETNLERKELLHVKYKSLRNELTKKKEIAKQITIRFILLIIQKKYQLYGKGSEW